MMEALAADLTLLCLEDVGDMKTRVRVEKPGALRFAKSMGVEMEYPKEAG